MGSTSLTGWFGYIFLVASLLATFSLLFKSMKDDWTPKDRVNQTVVLIVLAVLGAMIGGALLIGG
jgi:prolipoprotein diacylglyceryltransferase